jgi:putative membrane protein insertion efficiency factor
MKRAAIWLLRAYKWAISPLLLPACRYVPTCSEYAMEAVQRYGVVGGGSRAAWRVLRCNPFARGGFDPVIAPSAVGREHVSCEPMATGHRQVESDSSSKRSQPVNDRQLGTVSR